MHDAIMRVNRYMALLAIVAAIPDTFKDGFNIEWYGIQLYIYNSFDDNGETIAGSAKANMANAVRAIRRITGGTAEKGSDEYNFWVDIPVNDGKDKFRVISARRTVCERKVIGTVEVEIKDYEKAPTKTVTQEVVEWECSPLLEGVTE